MKEELVKKKTSRPESCRQMSLLAETCAEHVYSRGSESFGREKLARIIECHQITSLMRCQG